MKTPPVNVLVTFKLPLELAQVWESRCDVFGLNPDKLVAAIMHTHLINQRTNKTGDGQICSLESWLSGSRKLAPLPTQPLMRTVRPTAPAEPEIVQSMAEIPVVEEKLPLLRMLPWTPRREAVAVDG